MIKCEGLEITGKFANEVVGVFEGDSLCRNHFIICIQHGVRKVTFDYYGSNRDWENGKTELDHTDLHNALECILSDALAGAETFEDFVDEFGYTDPKTAYKTWEACQKSYFKFTDVLLINRNRIREIYNAMLEADDESEDSE